MDSYRKAFAIIDEIDKTILALTSETGDTILDKANKLNFIRTVEIHLRCHRELVLGKEVQDLEDPLFLHPARLPDSI